jgi:hypothetical protein
MAGNALDLPSIMWSNTRTCAFFVRHPKAQLHIFENSTLINDEQIGLEIFVKQAAFSDLSFLGQ